MDKAEETNNEDAHKEDEEGDLDEVLETQLKLKRPPTSGFDASPDDVPNDQPKKKAKTAASAEFKPPSRFGSQPSCGTIASPSGVGSVARSLSAKLAKWQHRRRSKSRLNELFFSLFCNHVWGRSRALAFNANAFIHH